MQKSIFHIFSCAFLSAFIALGITVSIVGCGSRSPSMEERQARFQDSISASATNIESEKLSDKAEEKAIRGQAADEEPSAPSAIRSPMRAFMRAAELRFRVNDVKNATERIEGLTRAYGGYVARSEQKSEVSLVTSASISNDSLLEKTLYTVTNSLSLRIPNAYFDTLLVKLQPMTDFLDYRRLSADDVSLSLLTNSFRAKRSRELAGHLRSAIDKSGKKLGEINDAETALAETQNTADESEIQNLHLKDKIDFCEVQLNIYQRRVKMERVIADNSKVEKFRSSFFARFWAAISNGWMNFWDLVVVLSEAWVFWLILFGGGYFIWKRMKTKN